MHSRALLALILLLTGLLGACAGSTSLTTPPARAREIASREAFLPSSLVDNVTVALAPGWNAVGLQSPVVTSLTANPEVLGVATYAPGGYSLGNYSQETLNAGVGGRRGFFLFARSATTFEYSGRDDGQGDFVDLTFPGYQLVSFCSAQEIQISRLTAQQNGQSVPSRR